MLIKTLYVTGTIFLLLLSLFVTGGIVFGGYYAYQNSKPLSILNTTTTIKQKIKPNKATTVATLEIRQKNSVEDKDTLTNLNKTADEETKLILKSITEAGVAIKNIKTNKFSTKDYSAAYNPDPIEIIKPKDMVVVDFTIIFEKLDTNLKKPNEILDALIPLGITRYSPLNYEIADQEIICEEIETKSLTKVSDKAKKQISELGGFIIKIEPNIIQSCMNNNYAYPMTAFKESLPSTVSDTNSNYPDVQTGEIELTVIANAKSEYR
jgi:uncharacterized protein YggE